MPALYDQFFLFGDSITQDSFNQARGFGFSAALQSAYIRRLDVVNRGLSGYNTRQALKVLPKIIPSPEEARIRILVVFLGANDAAVPQPVNNQHIPLEEYKENLRNIITHPQIQAHNARIALVAPPPVEEYLWRRVDEGFGREGLSREAARTRSYAIAACEVGRELRIPVIDLWTAFMKTTGWSPHEGSPSDPLPGSSELPQNEALVKLLHDGLHFTPEGYRILYDETMSLIEKQWPDQTAENLPMVLPAWSDASAWDESEAP